MSDDHDTSMQAALALLELGDDKDILETVTALREWARAVDADDKHPGLFRVFRGLVPARDGQTSPEPG